MTNQEAIKIVEDMMFNMSAEGLRISRDEDEAVEKLIQTAREYDALIASGKHYTYEDLMNMTLREK